jgi:DNA-binding CsgD family transcriptional regulator
VIRQSERRVLDLLVQGLGNAEIAEALVLSIKTVDSHLTNIKAKTGLRNRVLIALWWHDCGGLTA